MSAIEDVGMMRAGNETRRGDWMETWSGIKFFPLDPRPEEVYLADIAHHLSRINRYNGACQTECYSVAEHSVQMAGWLMRTKGDPRLAYQALFHDAPEAYIGDMVRPLKRNMPEFVTAEKPIYTAIVNAIPGLRAAHTQGFNLVYDLDPRVIEADNRILVNERAQVMQHSGHSWGIDHLEPLDEVVLEGWRPNLARDVFLVAEADLREMITG